MQISRRAVNFQLYAPANSAEFSADSNENSSSSGWEKYIEMAKKPERKKH